MSKDRLFQIIVLSLVFTFALIFFVTPNLLILFSSLNPPVLIGEDTNYIKKMIDHCARVVGPFYLKIYLHSILIGAYTLLLTFIIGYPFACAIYFIQNKYLQKFLLISIIVPFWTSSLIRTHCMTALLKTKGIINNSLLFLDIIGQPLDLLYNTTAIIIGFTYTLVPLMILPVYLSLTKIDKEIIEAAKDLGANSMQIFRSILLPLSVDGIISGSSMVFLSSLSMFYLADILGGGKYILISNLIKNKFLITNNWSLGCAICLLFYIFIVLFLLLHKKILSLELPNN